MAKAFRELIGVPPSTVSTEDSVFVIIDAQNEYVLHISSLVPRFYMIFIQHSISIPPTLRTPALNSPNLWTASGGDVLPLTNDRYINGHLKTENVSATRKAIATLLNKYRSANAPLAHVVHQTPSGAPVFTPSTPLAAIFDELTPRDAEKVITKHHPGSFTGTDLDEFIKGSGRSKVVLVGYMAHVCVSTTARQAAERGYDVIVVREAVGDRNIPGVQAEELVKVVLAELGDAFATIVSVEDVK